MPVSRDVTRKLTTIFCADVSGYSRLMDEDEVATLETLKTYREIMTGFITRHHGRVVSWSGDGVLADFASCVEAVTCAMEIQRELNGLNRRLPDHRQMHFRIGINLGDVMVEGHDIFGEGVNIAARLQSLAEPGGILISGTVYDQVRNKLSVGYDYLGEREVKNIADDVPVYQVDLSGSAVAGTLGPRQRKDPAHAATGSRYGGFARRGVAALIDWFAATLIAFVLIVPIELVFDDVVEVEMPIIGLSKENTVSERELPPHKVEGGEVVTTERIVRRQIFWLVSHTYRITSTEYRANDGKGMLVDADLKREMINPQTLEPIEPADTGVFTLVVWLLYVSVLEGRAAGAALGKRALGLQVRDEDGGELGFLRALGRNVAKVASVMTLFFGFFMALWTKRRQTLHDKLADCVVVVSRRERSQA